MKWLILLSSFIFCHGFHVSRVPSLRGVRNMLKAPLSSLGKAPSHLRQSFLVQMGRFDMEKPYVPPEPTFDRPSSEHKILLTDFVSSGTNDDDLTILFGAIANGIKSIATLTRRASLMKIQGSLGEASKSGASYIGEKVKKLDVLSNDVLNNQLVASQKVAVIATEEDDEPILSDPRYPFVVVHDPLDGSSNIEAGIPVGTIIGIYRNVHPSDPTANALQPGRDLLAACYALYSSSTTLVVSFRGSGPGAGQAHGFTLDSHASDFVLTHRAFRIPHHGASYSVNDGRYPDWPEGLKRYVDTVRRGEGVAGRPYRPCYICSLVADLHYTLFHGGVAMNPRSHLRLVYEANPLALIVEAAGGRASDGRQRVLERQPAALHERMPLFLGSRGDVEELESFGDVQQLGDFSYAAVT